MKNDGRVRSSHINRYVKPKIYKEILAASNMVLDTLKSKYTTIAFSGCSGILIGPPLALSQDKRMVLVRKSNDDTHSVNRVETGGQRRIGRYIIVDDFYSSGVTVSRIIRQIVQFDPKATFIGFLSVHGLTIKDVNARLVSKDKPELDKHEWMLKIERAAKRRHGKKH